jgi:RNA recognition motif-containing protein
MRRIFIRNIPYSSTSEDIQKLIESHGIATDYCKVVVDHTTQQSKGFAFAGVDDVQKAISILDRINFNGRVLNVKEAHDKQKK